jgi:TolB protein
MNSKPSRLASLFFVASVAVAPAAFAQLNSRDMPGTDGAVAGGPDATHVEEPLIEISVTSEQMPVLVLAHATASDVELAQQIGAEIQLTGLFNVRTTASMKLDPGLPERSKWPALSTAAVVVSKQTRPSGFPVVTSETYHAAESDVFRRRELVQYPGSETMTASTMADAILEDVLGVRAHMSGKLIMSDASTRGERSVRVVAPNGSRGRRISGFGSLARGPDFDHEMRAWYATEDPSGKLQLFKEGQATPVALGIPGYVQSVGFSPNGKHVVLSMGEGVHVRTWIGPSTDQVRMLPLPEEQTALSPSIDDQGRVVHAVGSVKGPFSVYVGDKRVTPPGVWAAMPSFCSTLIEDRVVYMVRAGRSWHVRITSLTNGSSRTVATNAMSPACSPDGRTVAFFSSGLYGKGPGVYLTADFGGQARKVWDGQAAGLRWRGGEKLPAKTIERLAPPEPETPETPETPGTPGTPEVPVDSESSLDVSLSPEQPPAADPPEEVTLDVSLP